MAEPGLRRSNSDLLDDFLKLRSGNISIQIEQQPRTNSCVRRSVSTGSMQMTSGGMRRSPKSSPLSNRSFSKGVRSRLRSSSPRKSPHSGISRSTLLRSSSSSQIQGPRRTGTLLRSNSAPQVQGPRRISGRKQSSSNRQVQAFGLHSANRALSRERSQFLQAFGLHGAKRAPSRERLQPKASAAQKATALGSKIHQPSSPSSNSPAGSSGKREGCMLLLEHEFFEVPTDSGCSAVSSPALIGHLPRSGKGQLLRSPSLSNSAISTCESLVHARRSPKYETHKKGIRSGSTTATRSLMGSSVHQKWATRAFQQLDLDGDGAIITCELRSGAFIEILQDCFEGDVPETAINAIVDYVIREADSDSDGLLSFEEFQAFTWKLKRMEFDTAVESDFVFSVFNSSAKQALDLQEFCQLLSFHGYDTSDAAVSSEAPQLFSEIDTNSDGLISKAEYQHWCETRWRGFSQQKHSAHFDWAASAFAELDLDGDGYLIACEMRSGVFLDKLRECFRETLPEDILHPVVDFAIKTANSKSHGQLSLRDFQTLTWRLRRMDTDVELEADFVFSVFGSHGRGVLDASQFQQLLDFHKNGGLANNAYAPCAAEIMQEIDTDGNGEITEAEYKEWTMKPSSPLGKFARPSLNVKRSLCDSSVTEG